MRKHVTARKLLRGQRQGMESSEGSGLQGISSLYHLTFKWLCRAQSEFRVGFFPNLPIWGRGLASAGRQQILSH